MLARYTCNLYNHQAGQLSRYFHFAFLKRKVLQGLNRFKDESGMTPCGKLDSRLVFFPLQNAVHSASLDVSLLGKFYLHIYKHMQHQKMYIHIWVRLSMQFSGQEYWSGLPFPSPGDIPNPGIELGSLALAGRFFTVWATREAHVHNLYMCFLWTGFSDTCIYVYIAMCACMPSRFSHVQFFAILLSVGHQAPLSMGFSRQEYWSGSPCPPPRDLPDPGI